MKTTEIIFTFYSTETDTTQTATTSSSNKDIPLPKKRIAILQMLENLEANLKMEEFNSDIKETFWNDLQEILTLTYPNASYKCILQCAKRDLARNDCSIIVTGETSAGKTTVIKQLVGQKLFHTKNVTTAPTVCKIRNSKQLILKAYRKESGDITTIYDEKRFENLKQMKVAIQRLIDNCHEDGEIKDTVFYTDISCPVPILKENVIIVDTPGIEESTDLDDILIDLLPEAVLLIFVVNARGIHKERMSTILKTILRNTDNMICFDPLDGFFLTYDDDDDNSENEILEELKKHWPTVKEDRIFKIKPSQSGSMEDNFYIKDCERFGACLREFIIRNHNKQAESYVSFILDLTENAIKLLDDIKDEKDKLIKQDSEKIRELEDNKDKYIENLHNHKKTLLDEVTCLILDYLKSTTAHDEILNPKEKPSIVKIDFDKIEAELRYRLQNAIKKYLNGRDVEEKVKYENEKIRSTCDKIPLEIKKVEIYKTEIIFELPLEQIKCSYGMEYKRSLHVELLESYSMYAVTRYNHLKYRLLGEKKRLKKAEKRLTYMISNIQKNELKTIAEQSIGKDYNNDVVSIFKDIILEIDRMKATKETMKGECDSLNSKCSSIRTLHNMLQNLKL
ncbi:unnamed protein product [Mytilus coruscus]|uniref:Dynamin N-terminal domain-containing protein n=1 Tax=Mytilus coruscus TaxID=42192 RepID=A0A6J8ENJ3_MYTCO|nr:unnamed protein product [Mytilus coruscus]